jgi:hypothetical protein
MVKASPNLLYVQTVFNLLPLYQHRSETLQIRINDLLGQIEIIKRYRPQRNQSKHERSPSDLCDVLDLFIFGHIESSKLWSGRRDSDSHTQLGRMRCYHYTTPAQKLLQKLLPKTKTVFVVFVKCLIAFV